MKRGSVVLIALVGLLAVQTASAGSVVLKRAWVEKYKNRSTIDAAAVALDHVKSGPNPVKEKGKDGDLHMAARSATVGLPFVAEIVNAAQQKAAIQIAKTAQADGKPVAMSGAWRLWFEHPDKE